MTKREWHKNLDAADDSKLRDALEELCDLPGYDMRWRLQKILRVAEQVDVDPEMFAELCLMTEDQLYRAAHP